MIDNVFIDTNIFIYSLTKPKDNKDSQKREISLNLLKKLVNESNIVISTQIINELHINMVRKFKIEDKEVFKTIQKNILAIASVESLTYQTYKIAFKVREKYNISYWDSLVVGSALENSCSILYSEDMQDELIIEKKLRIIKPFK